MSASDSAHNHLILSPPEWRQVLRAELITNGLEQDAAGVLARVVIERLVRRYLSGGLESAATTHTLDEAA